MNGLAVNELKKYRKGDIVHWENPESESPTNVYMIQEIQTESGEIEDWESILILKNDLGEIGLAMASEIH